MTVPSDKKQISFNKDVNVKLGRGRDTQTRMSDYIIRQLGQPDQDNSEISSTGKFGNSRQFKFSELGGKDPSAGGIKTFARDYYYQSLDSDYDQPKSNWPENNENVFMVYDSSKDVTWMHSPLTTGGSFTAATFTPDEAQAAADQSEYAGFKDWRLPSINYLSDNSTTVIANRVTNNYSGYDWDAKTELGHLYYNLTDNEGYLDKNRMVNPSFNHTSKNNTLMDFDSDDDTHLYMYQAAGIRNTLGHIVIFWMTGGSRTKKSPWSGTSYDKWVVDNADISHGMYLYHGFMGNAMAYYTSGGGAWLVRDGDVRPSSTIRFKSEGPAVQVVMPMAAYKSIAFTATSRVDAYNSPDIFLDPDTVRLQAIAIGSTIKGDGIADGTTVVSVTNNWIVLSKDTDGWHYAGTTVYFNENSGTFGYNHKTYGYRNVNTPGGTTLGELTDASGGSAIGANKSDYRINSLYRMDIGEALNFTTGLPKYGSYIFLSVDGDPDSSMSYSTGDPKTKTSRVKGLGLDHKGENTVILSGDYTDELSGVTSGVEGGNRWWLWDISKCATGDLHEIFNLFTPDLEATYGIYGTSDERSINIYASS